MSGVAMFALILSALANCEATSCSVGCSAGCGYRSCAEIKLHTPNAGNGMYEIRDDKGSIYTTYCDMVSGGGGWTLVASVHENYLGGKCTTGDRWSSEQGNNINHPDGDGNWANTNTFGMAESATSDDYKNPGYFNMDSKNVMIWHVPNGTPLSEYESKAFMKYHTYGDFLEEYGGNLYKLFKDHYPIKWNAYKKIVDNGPSPAVRWLRGDNAVRVGNTAPNLRAETTPGYIHFRVINNEGSVFAVCPGIRMYGGNVEHGCVGGTGYQREAPPRQCGDFSSYDWDGYGKGTGWSANLAMTESVVMIFYR